MSLSILVTCRKDFFDNMHNLCFVQGSEYVFEYDPTFDKTHPFMGINEVCLRHYLTIGQLERMFSFDQDEFDFLFRL